MFQPNPNPPIIIASPARCGATMVASLLYVHGVWFGEAKPSKMPRKPGFFGITNPNVDELLRSYSRKYTDESFRQELLKLVPPQGHWMIRSPQVLPRKHHFLYSFPDAIWLLPWRDSESIATSAMSHPKLKQQGYDRRLQIAQEHQELQKIVSERRPSKNHFINVANLGSGHEQEARMLVNFCGLAFDRYQWQQAIDPEKWHDGGT